ncbi:hypothetical protein BDV37DRAFT_277291 [Aspergillus pseudonomiae]|uniref:FAD-binding FR-type domain-containing protein n=1 Tax=Aspergillus pseudonomiae TaxID=1506151 RepID=A0A5N7CRT6_9EURO|nr:uncharacterized protein BDV37DRAFT_277291 [Aspergillus pseudonomiae]KAE8396950.1 hypothetical protein BDV37DRAFT_277291 [Aspergillus pseudonomiae]
MANFPFTRKSPEHYTEKLGSLVETATELSLFHDCKVYIFVDYPQHGFIFKSIQDPIWPPPDQYLSRNLSIKRLYAEDLVYSRFTEAERKDFIQLVLFFCDLAHRWGLASEIYPQSPRSPDVEENDMCEMSEDSVPYPRSSWRVFGIDSLSPLQVAMVMVYFIGTAVCNFIGVNTPSEKGTRAAHLSLINLLPLYFSGGRDFSARLLGLSLETYGIIHRTAGFMTVIQATVHVVITYHEVPFDSGCMFLSLLLLPTVKRRVYEVFLVTHLACAVLGLIWIWQHLDPAHDLSRKYLLACICTFTITGTFQLLRIIYRNKVLGKRSVRMVMKPYAEDIVQAILHLPRPWEVRAGERINLGVPSLGIFYLFQSHPFSITWWEVNAEGEAISVSILFRARTGFTRKALKCMEPDREYWAWIDGPFGPSPVHNYGLSREVGDYGHILMITTGIGIAAQLPYIKELLYLHRNARVTTQKITLVWQLDRTGDWESSRDWLQNLVKQDDGYMLEVMVYDPSSADNIQVPRKIGHHDLISFYGGKVNWEKILSTEMKRQAGKLLVTVSARRRIRNLVRQLVRNSVWFDVELFELEFQPWQERRDWLSFFTP